MPLPPRIAIATRNDHKLRELGRICAGWPVVWLTIHDHDGPWPDVEETGDTYLENALLKAHAVSAALGEPSMADDSGIEVDALGGKPGVHSARYHQLGPDGVPSRAIQQMAILKPELRTAANNRKLLAELAGVTERTARFRCVLALADVHGKLGTEVITADGICEGTILDAPRGSGGFGYDPLFLVAGTESTMAELDHDAKNVVSHRGKAMQAMEPRLRAYLVT